MNRKWKGIKIGWWIAGIAVVFVIGIIMSGTEDSTPEQADTTVASTQGQTAAPAKAAAEATTVPTAVPTRPPEPTPIPEQVMEVDLGEVIALVDSNNVAGDAKYKGKLVKLSGLISEIEADYVLIQALDRDEYFEMNAAKCKLHKEERSKVIALREDQELEVTGRIDGFGTSFGIQVKIKDCAILSVK